LAELWSGALPQMWSIFVSRVNISTAYNNSNAPLSPMLTSEHSHHNTLALRILCTLYQLCYNRAMVMHTFVLFYSHLRRMDKTNFHSHNNRKHVPEALWHDHLNNTIYRWISHTLLRCYHMTPRGHGIYRKEVNYICSRTSILPSFVWNNSHKEQILCHSGGHSIPHRIWDYPPSSCIPNIQGRRPFLAASVLYESLQSPSFALASPFLQLYLDHL